MFSAEFRASLQALSPKPARKVARGVASLPTELPQLEDDPNNVIDPDDQVSAYINVRLTVLLALPPIPPAWNHLLCGRSHETATALGARMALLAVGCYLGIHPSPSALEQVGRCRSAGAIRQLLRDAYGERGLSAAFELAGLRQPPKPAESLQLGSNSQSAETSARLVSYQGFTSQARIQRWFQREEPISPRWRSLPPPAGADDGAWVG